MKISEIAQLKKRILSVLCFSLFFFIVDFFVNALNFFVSPLMIFGVAIKYPPPDELGALATLPRTTACHLVNF